MKLRQWAWGAVTMVLLTRLLFVACSRWGCVRYPWTTWLLDRGGWAAAAFRWHRAAFYAVIAGLLVWYGYDQLKQRVTA